MKVLQVHNWYRSGSPSGEDRVVDQEGAALTAAGHEVERFERFSDDIKDWSPRRKVLVPARVLWSPETRSALNEFLRRFRPDVVHIHNTFPLLSPSVLSACRDARVPAVVTFHNYRPICPSGDFFRDGAVCHDCAGHLPLPAIFHGCYRSSAIATAPLAVATVAHRKVWRTLVSAYVFLSRSERNLFWSLRLPENRVFVKANLVPAPPFTPVTREHKVVYLGRLSETKGLFTLMKAFDRHSRASPASNLRVAIAGAGPLEGRVREWARVRPGVEMLGLLDPKACIYLLASARAVVVPSEWEETFGLVVIEAMACGVPSIASACGSLGELITHGVDGILFEPGSASALALVLTDLDQAPDRFAKLGERARRTYEDRFDSSGNLEALVSIYRFAMKHPIWREEVPTADSR